MAVVLKIGRRSASFSRRQAASAVRSTIIKDPSTGKFVKVPANKKLNGHAMNTEKATGRKK